MDSTQITEMSNDFMEWFNVNQNAIIDYSLSVIVSVILFFVGLKIARWCSNLTRRALTKKEIDQTITSFLSVLIRYSIIIFTIIAVLSNLGVQTASLIAILGAASLAIALSLQGSLSNFAAGVLLIVFRPIKSNEYIAVAGVDGTVQAIQFFSTTLLTPDGRVITVPNNKLISDNILNYSRDPLRRTQIMVSVSYNSKIDEVKKLLTDVINADSRILHDKGVTVRLHEMGSSSLNYVVRVWSTNSDAWPIYWDLMEAFKQTLDDHNIGIPYPQMDVHLRDITKDHQ